MLVALLLYLLALLHLQKRVQLKHSETQLRIRPVLSVSFLLKLVVQLLNPVETLGIRQLLGWKALVEYRVADLYVLKFN